MKFGRYTAQDNEDDGSRRGSESDEDLTQQPDNWARPGRIPRVGLESNAFPEIVVGDFGNSGIEGDDPATLLVSVYPEPNGQDSDTEGFLAEWEDIYSVGEMLRLMSMAHIPHSDRWNANWRPNCGRVQDANQEPGAPPYSDELIELLQRFEFPNQEHDLVRDLGEAIDTTFPSPEDIRDTLLPQAQARVAGFRRPASRPAGYFDSIDVSWTKPEQLMPFSYIMRYATEAGDGPDGRPPPEENDDPSGDQGDDGSGDGSGDESGDGPSVRGGDGEDIEMSDSPSFPAPEDEGDEGDDQPEDLEHRGGASDDSHDEDSDDDDNDDEQSMPPSPPPPPTSEQLAMRELGKMHKWNKAKPRYELRSLEYGVPVILPLKTPP
ncbi:hypothetical protein SLS64_008873 [Diaporthe eres]